MYSKFKTCIVFTLFSIFLFSCSNKITLGNGKVIDKQLVGNWEGSEKDKQVEGMEKKWLMVRSADGTFTLNFKTIYKGETDEIIETGNWWVEGSKFYEFHESSEKTDVYDYTVLNDNQVQFKMKSTDVEFADSDYVFIDTKVSEVTKKKKDGLSVENAIKVKDTKGEYEFVKENCNKCRFKSQSTQNHNEKYYDVLTFEDSNGSEVIYYFDINSFYGKW